MARPLKPLVRSGGFYSSRKWTPLVYAGGYTTENGGEEPAPPPIEKTIIGNPIHILDALAKPAQALSVKLEPVQDLHGYDNPWPGGATKNKLPKAIAKQETINGVTFNLDENGVYTITGTATASTICMFPVGSTFNILSGDPKPKISLGNSVGTNNVKFLLLNGESTVETWICTPVNRVSEYSAMRGKACDAYAIQVDAGYVANMTIAPMIVENSVKDYSYVPYSNICPISGRTSATIYHSGADTSDPTTYTIQIGDTVYGGTVDVVSGLLTVTHGNIASYAGESLPGEWISDMDVYSAGGTPTTGAQVVYELATPQTIQLTPQQVELLLGENNIWSDGEMTLTYLADGNASDE